MKALLIKRYNEVFNQIEISGKNLSDLIDTITHKLSNRDNLSAWAEVLSQRGFDLDAQIAVNRSNYLYH